MVYYYTSRNVKIIQSLMQDYRSLKDITPYEYIRDCFENRLQNIEERKVRWIIDVFLGLHKHGSFLKNIALEVGKMSHIEEDYFRIIAYGIFFQISPKNTQNVFKCLFNLNKVLLKIFIVFFISKDTIANITQIAQNEYDKYFVAENIIGPVLSWQPYLLEMSKIYNKYLKSPDICDKKKITPPKNRKNESHKNCALSFRPNAKFKIFTKYKIRKRHERNKNLVSHHKESTKTNFESDVCKNLSSRNINSLTTFKEAPKSTIRTTKSVIKRLNNTVKHSELNELKWFHDIVDNCKNTLKLEEILKRDKQEKEKDRILRLKKNYLIGKISHEDAIIAKNNIRNENKRKYNEFTKEKEQWEKEIKDWKLKQIEHNRKQVEKMSLLELNLQNSRNDMIEKRQEMAEIVRFNTKMLKEQILKNKESDLERRINIIKEFKTLAMFAKNSRMQKTVNLNKWRFGFLCEMSLPELQNSLATLKKSLEKELDEKKNKIKTLNIQEKQELEEIKKSNSVFMAEKEKMRHLEKTKIDNNIDLSPTDEINQLQILLQKRRNQRILLTKDNP